MSLLEKDGIYSLHNGSLSFIIVLNLHSVFELIVLVWYIFLLALWQSLRMYIHEGDALSQHVLGALGWPV